MSISISLISGAKVCISDINGDIGQQTAKEFSENYGKEKVTFKKCNVTIKKDWEDLWNYAESYFGDQVTLLVNNSG